MNEFETVGFTTRQFFLHEIDRNSRVHARRWGIVAVDTKGRHKHHLIGEDFAFKTRAEAKAAIEDEGYKFFG